MPKSFSARQYHGIEHRCRPQTLLLTLILSLLIAIFTPKADAIIPSSQAHSSAKQDAQGIREPCLGPLSKTAQFS